MTVKVSELKNGYASKTGNFLGLDSLIDGSEQDLDIENFLELYTNHLTEYTKKVAYGGRLTVRGTELNEIARGIINGLLTTNQVAIYMNNGRIKVFSVREIEQALEALGFKTVKKVVNGYQYVLVGERVGNAM